MTEAQEPNEFVNNHMLRVFRKPRSDESFVCQKVLDSCLEIFSCFAKDSKNYSKIKISGTTSIFPSKVSISAEKLPY